MKTNTFGKYPNIPICFVDTCPFLWFFCHFNFFWIWSVMCTDRVWYFTENTIFSILGYLWLYRYLGHFRFPACLSFSSFNFFNLSSSLLVHLSPSYAPFRLLSLLRTLSSSLPHKHPFCSSSLLKTLYASPFFRFKKKNEVFCHYSLLTLLTLLAQLKIHLLGFWVSFLLNPLLAPLFLVPRFNFCFFPDSTVEIFGLFFGNFWFWVLQVWDFWFFPYSTVKIFVSIFCELLVLNFAGLEKQDLKVRI